MKVIIAGGRDYGPSTHARIWLIKKLEELGCTEIVSGGAEGADLFGEKVARILGYEVTRFPVLPSEWKYLGRRAGPMRNEKMAIYSIQDGAKSACILFPGGKGTSDMKRHALKYGITVIEYEEG